MSCPIALVVLVLALASLEGQVQIADEGTLAPDSVERLDAFEEQGRASAEDGVGVTIRTRYRSEEYRRRSVQSLLENAVDAFIDSKSGVDWGEDWSSD